MRRSFFVKPMHPKSEILPRAETMVRLLNSGWVGQLKIHGHRVQIHIPEDPKDEILTYNRHGALHREKLSVPMVSELQRLYNPSRGWNVIDAEWLKPNKKLFVFDFIRHEGKLLRNLTYQERYNLLPKRYLSPHISTLPLLKTLTDCERAMADASPLVEGLVFKSLTTQGFKDTSIVRCRKR